MQWPKDAGRSEKLLFALIWVIFAIKLGDSLYIRQHGDALNYHLYAPLNWARFGWNYVNSFQATAWQGALLEGLTTILFKIWTPLEISTRESVLILFQTLSCVVGYFCIPVLLFFKVRRQVSIKALWLLILSFYGLEILTFTWAFAKNDSWAAFFFLLGFFSTSFWGVLALAIACGIKQTYLFGALFWIALQVKKENLGKTALSAIVIIAFPAAFWLKAYLATGNPFFPVKSGAGIQISSWLASYFAEYAGYSTTQEAVTKAAGVLMKSPFVILLGLFGLIGFAKTPTLTWAQRMFPAILVYYLFLTGKYLEMRTYSGVVFAVVYILVLQFDTFWLNRSRWIYYLIMILALTTSKIDPSSWARWKSAQGKGFAGLVRDGETFERINRTYSDRDVVLTELTNEGWFLIPQILTVNEHPLREEIRQKFPLLDAHSNMVAIRIQGDCKWGGESPVFTKALLEKSEADLKVDPEWPTLFHLEVTCAAL